MDFKLPNISFKSSIAFVSSMLISALIIYHLVGIQNGMAWSSFAVLCTYTLYNAKPDRSNALYIAFWIFIIMGSTYIGRFLHLTPYFYGYLFIVTYCYYFFFGRDPVFDRAIRFVIILSTIGTTIPHITVGLPLGAMVGTITALIMCQYIMHKNHDLDAFKQGIFTYEVFKLNTNIIPRAFIYSLGMFACLLLPLYLGVNKNYWAIITFIMVMTPKAETVILNTLQRFLGSVVAVIILYFVFQIPDQKTVIIIAFVIFSFILPMCFGKNIVLIAFSVTCYSLTLIELAGYWHYPTESLLLDRLAETAIGGGIAITISVILKAMRNENKTKS